MVYPSSVQVGGVTTAVYLSDSTPPATISTTNSSSLQLPAVHSVIVTGTIPSAAFSTLNLSLRITPSSLTSFIAVKLSQTALSAISQPFIITPSALLSEKPTYSSFVLSYDTTKPSATIPGLFLILISTVTVSPCFALAVPTLIVVFALPSANAAAAGIMVRTMHRTSSRLNTRFFICILLLKNL